MTKTPRKWIRFNYQKAADSFLKQVELIADEAVEHFYLEATTGNKNDVEIVRDPAINFYISNKVVFGASAIMESFGTGSAMDKNSRYLADYMRSNLYNKLRSDYAVVGRPEGEYTNIFGETKYSDGSLAGKNIEGMYYYPQNPTYTIQNAEKWLEQKDGWLDKLVKLRIEQWVSQEWNGFWEYS